MTKVLEFGSTIGILGAGQLGKMLAQSAQKMGYKVAMFDPNPTSCGFAVSHSHTVASFDDRQALLDFARSVDVLTYEFENINGELLKELEQETYLPQGTKLLLNSQHRRDEKNWLQSIGVPTVDFALVDNLLELKNSIVSIGLPAILKTTRFGYDGKGQMKLTTDIDLSEENTDLMEMLANECILEAFCEFEREVSVIVSRDLRENVVVFPVSQNLHISGILCAGLAPIEVSDNLQSKINEAANAIAISGKLVGVCGIEFFVTKDEDVIVNEIAPRPHNTGHYTIESCNVSQFDQHIIAITGHQLMAIQYQQPSLMINVLGQHMPAVVNLHEDFPNATYHIYDKGEAKQQRKMGHITFLGSSIVNLRGLWEESPSLQKWKELY